jgi:hypothetical protein
MTTQLPFVHPAHDPSMETTARARSHVLHAVRRRRTQRRVIGSAAFAALTVGGVAGVVAVAGSGDSTDGGTEAANPGAVGDREDVVPDTEWADPVLSADGRRLTIMVGSAPPGDDHCNQNFEYEVVESDTSVTIGFDLQAEARAQDPPPGDDVDAYACPAMAVPQRFEIDLGAPLGDRQVLDGVRPERQVVHRKAELVEATVLPDGFTAEEPFITEGDPYWWQQTFMGDGADWYVNVVQQRGAQPRTSDGTPVTVTVHGIEGTRYTGQMNNTMESIVWVEDGLTITVWGEMQGPPTFTHSDELLEIAEGVRLPGDG